MPGWNDPDKNNTDETIIKITQPGSGIGGSWEFVMDYEYRQSYTKYTKTYSWSFDNHGQYKYYEEIAETIYRNIDLTKLSDLSEGFELGYCYWISGKGIGGGIAAEGGHGDGQHRHFGTGVDD